MATMGGRDQAVARIYARAILDLAAAEGQEEQLLDELQELGRLIADDPELATFLGSPLVSQEARAEVLEKVLRGHASDLLVDALEVINRKGRLGLLPAIVNAYRDEFRELRGLVDARVVSAVPLPAKLRARLAEAVARFTGKQPVLIEQVDASILGGLVVEVAGDKFDSSVTTRLHDVGALLAQRAAQELHRGARPVEEQA
jgi:F-type H+-transporting ATPase subunit delta